jgi:hypothetical protein
MLMLFFTDSPKDVDVVFYPCIVAKDWSVLASGKPSEPGAWYLFCIQVVGDGQVACAAAPLPDKPSFI